MKNSAVQGALGRVYDAVESLAGWGGVINVSFASNKRHGVHQIVPERVVQIVFVLHSVSLAGDKWPCHDGNLRGRIIANKIDARNQGRRRIGDAASLETENVHGEYVAAGIEILRRQIVRPAFEHEHLAVATKNRGQ